MTQNRKVREQAERAEKLHAEIYGTTDQAPVEQPTDQQPVAQEAVTPNVAPEVQPQPVDDWEHRYRVLQGKYSAEVPRMAEEIRELKSMVQELKAAPQAPEAPALDLKSMTPEAVVEQFGEDFAAAVGAIAEQIAARQGKSIRDEFAPQVEAVAKSTAQTARQDFMRELTSLVPDWKEIDVSEDFTAFLDEADGLSGRSRRQSFNEADSQNNAQRIAKFFLAFKGNTPADQQKTPVDSRMSIENQIQPSTSRKSEAPAGKRFWTQADVRKFYRDVQRGLYADSEAKHIESDIFAAAQEGRMAA
jgi:hypothetical protein